MSGDPLVSIIVPVRNGERFIRRTLESALTQTYHPIEIIVVDDGSTDRTAPFVDALASYDKRCNLFRRPHSGVSASRNFGVSQARGTLIAPLDADDLWHPQKIARQVAVMQSSPAAVGLVYCWTIEIDEDDIIIPRAIDTGVAEGRVLTDVIARAGIITSGANPLIRRSYFDAVGGYDSSIGFGEDWKLQLCLAEICEFAVVPAYLVGYRRTTGSASKNITGMARSMENVSRWVVQRWPNTPPNIIESMNYHRNSYLAYLALTNNQFDSAIRYVLKSLKARPRALFSRSTLTFGARLLARMSGIQLYQRLRRTNAIAFDDFCSRNTCCLDKGNFSWTIK
jgi:glycosyltransferase involved in cell wall biosynthesis